MLEFDGSKLKELRQQRKMTITAVAAEVGKTVHHVWNYENGRATPPSDVLLSLMKFFKVPADGLSRTKTASTTN